MIHDCSHSFAELADAVLPAYLASLRASMKEPIPMAEFAVTGHGAVTISRRHGFDGDISGCYVLLEARRPVYVGISKHVFERLLQHVRPGDHLTATLAYRMAVARHPFKGDAKRAMADPAFRAEFNRMREGLTRLEVAVVQIDNPLELYVFEAYCAMELGTGVEQGGWNTFETH